MVWSKELRDKVGLDMVGTLRKLSVTEGRNFLRSSFIEFTPDEIDQVVTLCKPDEQVQQIPENRAQLLVIDPTRRLWLQAAWLLGASWRQLAALHNIAHSSVAQSARKGFDPELRARRAPNPMDYPRLLRMRQYYLDHRNDFMAIGDPEEVARRLELLDMEEGE